MKNIFQGTHFTLYIPHFAKTYSRHSNCGYSFRDTSINNALLDNFQSSESSRLIISVKSDSVKQRISKIFGQNKRISLIDKYFGEDGFIDELKNELILIRI